MLDLRALMNNDVWLHILPKLRKSIRNIEAIIKNKKIDILVRH